MNTLLKYGKYGSIYAAIEHYAVNEKEKLNLVLLKKNKNEFILKSQKQYSSLDEVTYSIPKSQHLYVIINNQKVLSKTIKKEINSTKALQIAYPALKKIDFYYEIIQLKDTTHIAICRKDEVDNLIKQYRKNKINIIGFSLGNTAINQLIPFSESSALITNNAKINIENNQAVSIDLNNNFEKTNYSINGLKISNEETLVLSGIITYFSNSCTSHSNFKKLEASLVKEFSLNRLIKIAISTGLALLLSSLIINFLMFDYYNTEVGNLSYKNQVNQSKKEQLLKLNTEVLNKKKLVDAIMNSATSKSSLYFNNIGRSIPTTVKLTTLNYHPVLKKMENQKKIHLDKNIIQIEGTSTNGDNFTEWVNQLEKIEWIKSVEISRYGIDKKKRTMFILKIWMR